MNGHQNLNLSERLQQRLSEQMEEVATLTQAELQKLEASLNEQCNAALSTTSSDIEILMGQTKRLKSEFKALSQELEQNRRNRWFTPMVISMIAVASVSVPLIFLAIWSNSQVSSAQAQAQYLQGQIEQAKDTQHQLGLYGFHLQQQATGEVFLIGPVFGKPTKIESGGYAVRIK